MIVKRLKRALNEIIDWNQSAYVPGRSITDNIIVGYECMQIIRQKRGNMNGFEVLK